MEHATSVLARSHPHSLQLDVDVRNSYMTLCNRRSLGLARLSLDDGVDDDGIGAAYDDASSDGNRSRSSSNAALIDDGQGFLEGNNPQSAAGGGEVRSAGVYAGILKVVVLPSCRLGLRSLLFAEVFGPYSQPPIPLPTTSTVPLRCGWCSTSDSISTHTLSSPIAYTCALFSYAHTKTTPTTIIDGQQNAGSSTVPEASFNFINSIVGAGLIGIPFALYV